MELQIKESLIALLAGIKASDGGVIAAEMAKLDDYLERGRLGLHPQLAHFLERRSYAKALTFLDGDAAGIPRGTCAPKNPRTGGAA
jgi:hypothetical protein